MSKTLNRSRLHKLLEWADYGQRVILQTAKGKCKDHSNKWNRSSLSNWRKLVKVLMVFKALTGEQNGSSLQRLPFWTRKHEQNFPLQNMLNRLLERFVINWCYWVLGLRCLKFWKSSITFHCDVALWEVAMCLAKKKNKQEFSWRLENFWNSFVRLEFSRDLSFSCILSPNILTCSHIFLGYKQAMWADSHGYKDSPLILWKIQRN